MVANLMTKLLQGKKFIEFRDRIMGMTQKPETENNTRGRKMKYAITRERFNSDQTDNGLNRENPNPQKCVGNVETDIIF